MTREESLNLAKYEETPYYFQRLINKIYDEFDLELKELENRSCGNCKYSYYDKEDAIVICTNEDNNQEYLYNSKMQITLDFYCNKWENKA